MKNIFVFLTVSMLFGGVAESAQAKSVQYNLDCGTEICSSAATIWFDAHPETTTYSPGQAINISGLLSSDDWPTEAPFNPFLRVRVEGVSSYTGDLITTSYSAQGIRDANPFTVSSGLNAPLTPGSYTLNFSLNIQQSKTGYGYRTFPANAGQFDVPFTVVAPSGTIGVSANIAGASWTITGPATLSGSGTARTYNSQPTGVYNITWNPVPGYSSPSSSAKTLTSGGTINFSGNYTAAPTCSYSGTIYWPNASGQCSASVSVSGVPVGENRTATDNDASGNSYTGSWTGKCNASGGWDLVSQTCAPPAPTINVRF